MQKLIEELRSENATARYRASIALSRIGEPAVPALIEALRDPKYETRIAAANAIRDMSSAGASAVAALAENLSYSGDRELGYPPKDPSLYAGSPALQVRWCAVAALGHLGPGALPAVPALLEALRGAHEDGMAGPRPDDLYGQKHWRAFEMRGAAAWVLQKLGPAAAARCPETIPALAAALRDPARMVRLNAAAALRAMGPAAKGAVPALLEALKHPDPYTRIYAARAFTALGRDGEPYLSALRECLASIRLDERSRRQIAEAIFAVSGRRPRLERAQRAARKPAPPRWAALERRDFLLAVQPFQDSSLLIDPDRLVQTFVGARVGNAITCWPDHVWYNTPPPTAEELEQSGMAMVWYFFTEDIFNPKLQRDWGFATLDDYNRDMAERILETGRVLGRDRALWAIGHEQMDALHGWGVQADGSYRKPEFRTKAEGCDFYRRWIMTSVHQRHWMEYGNTRPGKFFDGWDPGAKATWEFLADHHVDTSPVTMLSGGVSPVLAHASFDTLPQIGMYWWECQIDGASLQVGAAYTRGAARQYGKRWLLDVSPWSPVLGSPGWGYVDGKWTGGATDAMLLRSWIYGYLSGAAVVLEESSGATHFRIDPYPNGPSDRPLLTTTGRTAQEAARFCFELCPDRGEPYNPVGLLLEHEHGFEPRPHTNFRGSGPWGFMPMGEGEYEIEQFWYTAFPGHSSRPRPAGGDAADPRAREHRILTESAFGDCFDVLTDRAAPAVLARYPRLMTLGGIRIDGVLRARLKAYVAAGGELLVNAAHIAGDAADEAFYGVRIGDWRETRDASSDFPIVVRDVTPVTARVVQATPSGQPLITMNAVGRGKLYLITARHSLSGARLDGSSRWLLSVAGFLREWIRPVWPVSVTPRDGAQPQVMLNRLSNGWLLTLGNHQRPDTLTAEVSLQLEKDRPVTVRDLWSQAEVHSERRTGALRFEAAVPPYTFRVYRIAAGR